MNFFKKIISFKTSYLVSQFTANGNLLYKGSVLSDRGLVRKNNEDSILITGYPEKRPNLLICAVADGMGGGAFGEEASCAAVDMLRELFDSILERQEKPDNWARWLQEALIRANLAVIDKAALIGTDSTVGSTLVAALMVGNKAYVVNAGDSRAYLLRDRKLDKITCDHSLVSVMVEKELITPDEIYTHPRRNEIMRFLGQNTELLVDSFEIDLKAGDRLLLCSDGLWGMVRDRQMEILLNYYKTPVEACVKMVEEAKNNGGEDNISVIIVDVEGRPKSG